MALDREYKIVRYYIRNGKSVLHTRVTLAEAQEHCRDPEMNSRTATNATARNRTKRFGPWFDGYERR